MSANEFAGLLHAPRREVISLESVLSEAARDLLLEEDDKWRPRHDLIAVEMLRQLLTMANDKSSSSAHLDNCKNHLADRAVEFFSHMSENVVSDVLLSRVSGDTSHLYISFSQLILTSHLKKMQSTCLRKPYSCFQITHFLSFTWAATIAFRKSRLAFIWLSSPQMRGSVAPRAFHV